MFIGDTTWVPLWCLHCLLLFDWYQNITRKTETKLTYRLNSIKISQMYLSVCSWLCTRRHLSEISYHTLCYSVSFVFVTRCYVTLNSRFRLLFRRPQHGLRIHDGREHCDGVGVSARWWWGWVWECVMSVVTISRWHAYRAHNKLGAAVLYIASRPPTYTNTEHRLIGRMQSPRELNLQQRSPMRNNELRTDRITDVTWETSVIDGGPDSRCI